MAHKPRRPTDAELEILTVFWSIGPATVREVYEVVCRRRTAQYSTVLKFMQIMAEKGLVHRMRNSARMSTNRQRRASGRSGSLPEICWSEHLADRPRRSS